MVARKSVYGLTVSEWTAIIGIIITVLSVLILTSTKINANTIRVDNLEKEQESCKIKIEKTKDDVSEIKGDIKEINAKLDILIESK